MGISFSTPIVLIIFNRPDTTQQVFERIRQIRPQHLLVVADGPRHPYDKEKCTQARAILEKVDWDCQISTNFSEDNLGCRKRISSGLNWVFSQVEEAIILEDDCLPGLSFFNFCETLLRRFRNDERIFHISGCNYGIPWDDYPYSYCFTKYPSCWGWATWKRAWNTYDLDLQTWSDFRDVGGMSGICPDDAENLYWSCIFETMADPVARLKAGRPAESWVYPWMYNCWSQHGLSVMPKVNLVSNIGFGKDSTHTTNLDDPLANLTAFELDEIHHPPFVNCIYDLDMYIFNERFRGSYFRNTIEESISHD